MCTLCICLWNSHVNVYRYILQGGPALLGQDMATVASLLEIVVILWGSVEKALKQNEEAHKYTAAKFGNVMAKYFQAFEVF